MPTHASRSVRSSCRPLVPVALGRPTPSEGGTNPRGGAVIADGAIRDWRM